jgi:hypothetical protein
MTITIREITDDDIAQVVEVWATSGVTRPWNDPAQIMAAAEAWLTNRGVWKVQLLVRDGNENVKSFYERLGYSDTKARCFQKSLKQS